MLPLRDLLRELELQRRRRGGRAGPRRCAGCTSPSSLDPTPWLSGGELLLTTGLQLSDDDAQREYVARLASTG